MATQATSNRAQSGSASGQLHLPFPKGYGEDFFREEHSNGGHTTHFGDGELNWAPGEEPVNPNQAHVLYSCH